MLVTATHESGQDVFVSFDKEALKAISSVANHPLFSDEANWEMVSIVFKHESSAKRIVSGFKNDFVKTDNVKVQPDMVAGEIYELHEILISGDGRVPILSIKREDIANASSMDFTLGEGGVEPPPPPSIASVTLSSSSSASVYDSFSVTASFSKSISGFASDDISVTNATISNFSGSGSSYTFDVVPSSDGAITIEVGSNKVTGGNSASNQLSRTYYSPVSATLSSSAGSSVFNSFSVTATFGESVTDFSLDDLSLTNCSASNLAGSGSSYTFDIIPISGGNVSVEIMSSAAQASSGASTLASNSISTFYVTPVSAVLSTASVGDNIYSPFSMTATFGESVTNFTSSGLSLVNATVSNFSGSGSVYTFTVNPTQTGSLSVQIVAQSALASSGARNSASNTIQRQYYAPVTVALSTSASSTVAGAFTVTATFSESAGTFTVSDLDLVNCTVASIDAYSLSSYQFTVTPTSSGSVSVQVKSASVQALASGAFNTASNTLSVTYSAPSSWVGANSAVWNLASNWNPQIVPNSSTAVASISRNISGTASASAVVDADVMVNSLKFTLSSPSTQWSLTNSNSKSLTLGGSSPTIESSQSNTSILSPIVIDGDLNIKGTSNYSFGSNSTTGRVTANNKNILIDGTVLSATFTFNNASTWQGGTLTFSNVLMGNINSYTGQFGGINGPKIIYKNDAMSSLYGSSTNSGVLRSATSIPNAIEFSDIGSYNFKVQALMTGIVTGTVSKSIYLEAVQGGAGMTGNISGLTFNGNGKLVIRSGTTANFTSSAMNGGEISFSDSTENQTLALANYTVARYDSGGTISHTLKVRGSCMNQLYLPTGSNFAGSIVMNPDGDVKAGSVFYILNPTGSATVSGVISNGATNPQNMTFKSLSGTVKLTGTNTYSSPTVAENGILEVSGSIANSSVTISAANGRLNLTGTCGPLTNNGTSYGLYVHAASSPTTTSIGTVMGNFVNNGKMLINFTTGGVCNKLIVNGNVTLGGSINHNGLAPQTGTYTIMEYTGTRTGTFATNNLGAGTTITYDDANKRVLVTKA
jgi:hypothetical protein